MSGFPAVLYGCVAYAAFLASLSYAVGFIGNLAVPKSIDSGAAGSPLESAVVDLLLFALFALQHSVMARQGFKRWWARLVPPAVERSTYVLFSSLVLAILFWQWRPIPDPVWTVRDPIAATALDAVFWLGWAMLLFSTFLLNHFELFGLSQIFARILGREPSPPSFRTPLLYRHVRHPLYLSFLLAFWATPSMSAGRLLFAIASTGYILIAIQLEERDLIAAFGDQYRRYREQVAMLLPLPGRKLPDRHDA